MDADEVKFVVPSGAENSTAHYLYLHDGRILRINPATGKVLGVATLPSQAGITAFVDRKLNRKKA